MDLFKQALCPLPEGLEEALRRGLNFVDRKALAVWAANERRLAAEVERRVRRNRWRALLATTDALVNALRGLLRMQKGREQWSEVVNADAALAQAESAPELIARRSAGVKCACGGQADLAQEYLTAEAAEGFDQRQAPCCQCGRTLVYVVR
jgi:hypothetical protein